MKNSCIRHCVLFSILTLTIPGIATTRIGANDSKSVTLLRAPNNGIQPQAFVDANGVMHVIYLAGDPKKADVFYVRSEDGKSFSRPVPVNSVPGSAIAIGNVRGAHLAQGFAVAPA